MSNQHKHPVITASKQELDAFLDQVTRAPATLNTGAEGRLLFALDATASRQRTWDQACHLQSEMFIEAGKTGGLQVQLCYYHGYAQFEHTGWFSNTHALLDRMNQVSCMAGHTQLLRVLNHALLETRRRKIQAVVFIGDCLEEPADKLSRLAGELGLLGTPVFIFQEGNELVAKRTFKELARLSGGAYCGFNSGSAQILKALLAAVAVYAAGGPKALENFAKDKPGEVLQLTHQLKGHSRS
ncbi:MAG: VWA domain-containing protein [Oceanospirillaceae bacterium]|nr:VWA domain-containing protein [Oceanospirillaceae bacterium]